jgi:D-psicose/D-tagatose/L-ribulose 3-epimerase
MRFGVLTVIWTTPFQTSELRLVDHAAELGFDVLECAVEQVGAMDTGRLKEALDRAGLGSTVAMAFSPDRDVAHADAAVRKGGIDYIKHCIDVAVQIGAPVASGPMYAATGKARLLPPSERRAEFERAAESLKAVADYAGQNGVDLAIEPLNRFETDMVNTTEQGLEMCDLIGQPSAGLLLDTFHMNIEEKSIGDAIRMAKGRIFHFHSCENDRGTPGSGHVPWDEVAQALRDVEYDRVVSIESFVPDIPELAGAVKMWREVFSSPDDLAREGQAFLRQLLT